MKWKHGRAKIRLGNKSNAYHAFKENKQSFFKEGIDRINYTGRVYNEKEMTALTDAVLDFWLTTERFANEMEEMLERFVGVKYAHLVNRGSSANLIAFMVLTALELGERRIKKGG